MKPSARRTARVPYLSAGTLEPAAAVVVALISTLLLAVEVCAGETGDQRATPSGGRVATKLAPPLPAVTEDVMWKKYNEYGVTAYSRGSLPEAARMFRNAFKALQKKARPGSALSDSKDLRLATVMTNLGAVYRDMGKHASAEQLLKGAIEIKRKQLSNSDPSLLVSLKHYAKLLRNTHRETDADLLDSRADMIAWSKQATPEELLLAKEWSPRRLAQPIRQLATVRKRAGTRESTHPFDSSSGFGQWREFDNWRPTPPGGFGDDGGGSYGFTPSGFHPKSLVFRGLSPDDPNVPTWKARVTMERRVWNGEIFPAIMGNGPPVLPGPGSGECDDYRGARSANPPVVIAPWTSPTIVGRPAPGLGGPQVPGFAGGFGVPGGRPAMGTPAGVPAPMRVLAPGGRWR